MLATASPAGSSPLSVLVTGFDPFGGSAVNPSWDAIHALDGRVIAGHRVVGGEIPTVKVNRLLLRNTSVVGAGWGEYVRTFPDYPARQWAQLEPLLRSGALQVPEPTLHPMTSAADALLSLADRTATGKVALSLQP